MGIICDNWSFLPAIPFGGSDEVGSSYGPSAVASEMDFINGGGYNRRQSSSSATLEKPLTENGYHIAAVKTPTELAYTDGVLKKRRY